MRSLVISDLHLGARGDMDTLRARPEALDALLGALEGSDRLVLLGDVLELRHGPSRDALAAARPVLRALGDGLAPGAEVVLVAGNHDHRVVAPWLEERLDAGAHPLGLAERTTPDATPLAAAVAAALAPAHRLEVHLDYPGTWAADGVWATHGHYLDRHVTAPSAERLAIGAIARLRGATDGAIASPDDYEAALAPLYALVDALAARRPGARGGAGHETNPSSVVLRAVSDGSAPLRLLLAGAVPAAVAALNAAGLGPLQADLSGPGLRRSALAAMAEVVRRLRVGARHVVFGHTHRAGPDAGDDPVEWALSGGSLLNCGCWVRDPVFGADADLASPYRAGGAVVLDDDAPPRLVRLLG